MIGCVILAGLPLVIVSIECLASLLPVRRRRLGEHRPPCAIIIPAHNEESEIAATIASIQAQTWEGDRILVVADNCTDQTAAIARSAGAEVRERTDAERRGKGFAMDFGVSALAERPPDVVVFVDADCTLQPAALDNLVRTAVTTARPVQGIYLIGTGQESDVRRRLSAFAVVLKNHIRPLGLHRLGLPCLLTGTGMAFPWSRIRSLELGNGHIVEDMKLGAEAALAGFPPVLCPTARLSGSPAPDRRSAMKQRTRWEHGHTAVSIRYAPRLLLMGLATLRPKLFGLGCELAVLPLSLVGLIFLFCSLIAVVWATTTDHTAPVWCAVGISVGSVFSFAAAWVVHGRKILPLRSALAVPIYMFWKLPIYFRLVFSREKQWIRTRREGDNSGSQAR